MSAAKLGGRDRTQSAKADFAPYSPRFESGPSSGAGSALFAFIRVHSRPVLLGLFACLLCIPAVAQESVPTPAGNPKEICYQVGTTLAERWPGMCRRSVHWFVAVDVSESMGPKLDLVKRFLGEWVPSVVAQDDRITLLAFGKRIREAGTWTVGASPHDVLPLLLDPLVLGKGIPGSSLQEARRRVLELAAAAARSDSSRLPLTLVVSDRDDPDAIPAQNGFTRGLRAKFGDAFGPGEGERAPGDEGVEGMRQFEVLSSGSPDARYLVVVFSGGRRPGPASTSGIKNRWVPLGETQEIPGFTPEDPAAGVRLVLMLAPWVTLAILGACVLFLARAPAGRLERHGNLPRRLLLPWWPFRRKPSPVLASNTSSGFCLTPADAGKAELPVLEVTLHEPWSLRRWAAAVQSADQRLRLRTDLHDWADELLLEPTGERLLEVRDPGGIVATGRVEFLENLKTRRLYVSCLVLSGLFVILAIAAPIFNAVLRPPESTPSTVVVRKDLCS